MTSPADHNADGDFDVWLQALRHRDRTERAHAAEYCPDDERVLPELVTSLRDPDELVRTCAAESLGMFASPSAREALREFIEREEGDLPRSYALLSLGDVAEFDDLEFFLRRIPTTVGARSQIAALAGFLAAARRVTTAGVVPFLHHESDLVRATAANVLVGLRESFDEDSVTSAIRSQLAHESEAFVRSILQRALADLTGAVLATDDSLASDGKK